MRILWNGPAIPAALLVLSLLSWSSAFAQMRHTPAPTDSLVHIYAVVPLIGAGTAADPETMFAPAEGIKPVLPTAAPGTAADAAGAASQYPGPVLDLGGEGTIPGAINFQPGSNVNGMLSGNATIQESAALGNTYVMGSSNQLPFDFSFQTVVTNNVPIYVPGSSASIPMLEG